MLLLFVIIGIKKIPWKRCMIEVLCVRTYSYAQHVTMRRFGMKTHFQPRACVTFMGKISIDI